MSAIHAIKQAEAVARRQAVIDRVLDWIERADTVDIVRETPVMKPECCGVGSPYRPTGELTIELKLTGIDGIEAELCQGGRSHYPVDWSVM